MFQQLYTSLDSKLSQQEFRMVYYSKLNLEQYSVANSLMY